jgi:hypothetical protein
VSHSASRYPFVIALLSPGNKIEVHSVNDEVHLQTVNLWEMFANLLDGPQVSLLFSPTKVACEGL